MKLKLKPSLMLELIRAYKKASGKSWLSVTASGFSSLGGSGGVLDGALNFLFGGRHVSLAAIIISDKRMLTCLKLDYDAGKARELSVIGLSGGLAGEKLSVAHEFLSRNYGITHTLKIDMDEAFASHAGSSEEWARKLFETECFSVYPLRITGGPA